VTFAPCGRNCPGCVAAVVTAILYDLLVAVSVAQVSMNKIYRWSSVEHAVFETNLLCSKAGTEISFSHEILFIKKEQVTDTKGKQIFVFLCF
jgi:hypothetical protein